MVISRWISRIFKLHRHKTVWGLRCQLARFLDGAFDSLVARRVDESRPESLHQLLFFKTKLFRDDEDSWQAVLLGGQGHPNAGIAGGGFNNGGFSFSHFTVVDGVLNHVLTQAVLDAAAGIKHFKFGVNMTVVRNVNL